MNSLFDAEIDALEAHARQLAEILARLPLPERVEALNRVRQVFHEISPFAEEPVDCVVWVPAEAVQGNDYNPNTVAPPEMRLLEHSIRADGYTQPIVAMAETPMHYVIVDGFHRQRVGKESRAVRERVHGYLPVTVIRTDRTDTNDRMAATIRHNRARGVHGVIPLRDLVVTVLQQGWSDEQVCRELGMDPDELLRFKQTSGLPGLFKDRGYSRSWE